ncbi:MAG: bifunctional nuclease family protein [Lentimicrobiaceae bacterium]|nr:bifunctional nuclease family protein [Lentimicrobiaceae bacterium]
MEKIRLEVVGMSYSQSQSGAYALILVESGGKRRLPIIIGGFEAQAIAIELEKMKPSRPLTHDLFRSFAQAYHVNIKEVVINKFQEGVFFARLVCDRGGESCEIDSRTSDAVALALRFNCPIYTYPAIMDAAAIAVDDEVIEEMNEIPPDDEENTRSSLFLYTLEELQEMLDKAISQEEYEEASMIRDEINRRKDEGEDA